MYGVNRLVEALPRKHRSSLIARSESVDLVLGEILCEPDQPFRFVYFPLGGYVSLRRLIDGGRPLEMSPVGNEGMIGATLALGINSAHLQGLVQKGGSALRMDVGQFRRQLRDTPALSRGIHAYLHGVLGQLSSTAACVHYHEIDKRLARWLLMNHDRAHADHFHLTHKLLADTLGVQRSAVTIAAGELRRKAIISYSRGEITILDRSALEAVSCGCYEWVTNSRRFH
jgi:CRP-like cAMP-binding protein